MLENEDDLLSCTISDEQLEQLLKEEDEFYSDLSWLGPYQGKRSRRPDIRICSHCGAEVQQAWVYRDGLAYYCSEECLLNHFEAEVWNEMIAAAESPEGIDPGLAYYADYTDRRW